MNPLLETIAGSLNYGDLPETWQVPDIDIAESLSNILGKPIRKRTADSVTFADGSTEKTNQETMTEEEKRHFVSLIKPYLWAGEVMVHSDFWNFGTEKESLVHRIHSYPAKFPGFITTKALQYAEEQGVKVETVADIFCGCGTTAVEAKRNGKKFWGYDINPVATMIAKVKTKQYKDCVLETYFSAIVKRFGSIKIDKDDIDTVNDRIKYWYDEENIEDLFKLREAIFSAVSQHSFYRKFFLCAFSNILKPTSRWLTKSIKPQFDPDKTPKDVMESV